MNFSYRKANVQPPRPRRLGIGKNWIILSDFYEKLIQLNFIIVYIEEWSFNPSSLPLYIWMKIREPNAKVIRSSTERYNLVASQWENHVYLMIKSGTLNEGSEQWFIGLLLKQLELTIRKKQWRQELHFLIDNARKHRTNKIINKIKKIIMVVFTFPSYTCELNEIEHTFESLKSKISFKI